MKIHKSHSKLELVKIVESFDIPIINPRQFRKTDLSALIVNKLNQMEYIIPCEYFWFCNLIDLKLYLQTINPKKIISVKEKSNIIDICRRIKHYCHNGSHIEINRFKNIDDVYTAGEYIKKYGDIPSVRKALRDLNNLIDKKYIIKPIISDYMKKELDKREHMKKKGIYRYKISHGKFIVDFP